MRRTGLVSLAVTAATAALLGACATLTRGTSQTVAITTPGVSGASCALTSAAIGSRAVVTPATVTLEKSQESIAVRCTKECYTDGSGIIASNMEAMSAGNLILGGVVGLGVDAASGAMNKYSPETQIVMVPIQGCRAGGGGGEPARSEPTRPVAKASAKR